MIKPTVTKARLAWLELLEREGIARRPLNLGPVGYHTAALGWTQRAFKHNETGRTIGEDDFMSRHGLTDSPLWDDFTFAGEMLTEAGRIILADHRLPPPYKTAKGLELATIDLAIIFAALVKVGYSPQQIALAIRSAFTIAGRDLSDELEHREEEVEEGEGNEHGHA